MLALPPDAQLGLGNATEDSEAAALWVVETCRRWAKQLPAGQAEAPGKGRQQQLEWGSERR